MARQNLLASAARAVSGNSGALPALRNFHLIKAVSFLLTVAAAATEAGDTLDVYIQSSPDDGTTWDDFVHLTQVLGNGGAKKYVATWTREVVPESELHAPVDAALAVGVQQGPINSIWRVKWVIVDGGAANASFTFDVLANPIYGER